MFLDQFPTEGKQQGWIEVICGSMFSGKTEELIRRLRRAEFANQKILLFKPKTDNRFASSEVISHKGSSLDSVVIENAADAFKIWNNERIVAFDEAQFFDEGIIEVSKKLADSGVRVLCAGLDMDFQGNGFGPMPLLMATAEYVTKVHAICRRTGNLANYSMRTSDGKNLVELGETESYDAVSRRVFVDEVLSKKEV